MQVAGGSHDIADWWLQWRRRGQVPVHLQFTRTEMRPADAVAGVWMMHLATKLNLKPGTTVRLIAAPPGVVLGCGSRISVTTDDATCDAPVVFVTNQAALENHEAVVVEPASADRLTWLACPKGGSLEPT